jgi:hypothetical protein
MPISDSEFRAFSLSVIVIARQTLAGTFFY